MRIIFDVSPLSHPRTGIGNYIVGSLRGLVEAARGRHEIVAFAPTSLRGPRAIREALAGVDVDLRLIPLPASHAIRTAWSRARRPAAERLLGSFDALHFSDWMYPPQRAGVRSTVVHDLVPLRFPGWVTARTYAMHTRKYLDAARTCDVIFANSQFTADDVVQLLGVDQGRVRVAAPGVGSAFRPDGPRYSWPRPYVLGIGTIEPRKNLETLVAGWRPLAEELDLLIAGADGWGERPDLADPRIQLLGYVSDDAVAALYRGAVAFVYPSRFEGFGMPIVEAMACGCPAVASGHPSLDQASGSIAIRVDPNDPAAVTRAIEEARRDRGALRKDGLRHAGAFTWRATGEALLGGFEAVS